ncbi:MAG: hypothetical protein SCALA702_14060 [Melioribacteraceae bacterium]|nr:MAG: hypothetical protein SCALA702_14060 [Melioribacteraceae bacterium]
MYNQLMASLLILMLSTTLFSQDATKLFDRRGYLIQSAMNYGVDNGGYWDIPGHPKKIEKSMNIQVWDLDKDKDRKYYMVASDIEGYYEIKPGWQKGIRIDVAGGAPNMNKNGANIATWSKNSKEWQKFRFKHLGEGKFKIYTTSGMVVCLDGRKSVNGTNVHLWEDHEGAWMEWYLIDPSTKKPFIPVSIQPYSKSAPEFFQRNKDKTFIYDMQLAFVEGSKGTATVASVEGNVVKLNVTAEGIDHTNGQKVTKEFVLTLNHKDGKYINGNWDCMECGQGELRIEPDGRQVLTLSGEQHALDIILDIE